MFTKRYTGDNLEMWKQVYNLVDSKVFRISKNTYEQCKRLPYVLPPEVKELTDMLGELTQQPSKERCEQIAAYATSPAINHMIFG